MSYPKESKKKKEMNYCKHLGTECVIKGRVYDLHLSKPEVYNSNCSDIRAGGHSAFGYVEYRISEDGGDTFGQIQVLPFSWETLMGGMHAVSVEKAVACEDGGATWVETGKSYVYSNNIVLDHPHKTGKKRMLVQYSELYKEKSGCVDVMHMWIESVE